MATATRLPESRGSVERVVEVSQELVADAIRLARLEATAALRRALAAALLAGATAALFGLAWVAGAVACALSLAPALGSAGAVSAVAAVHLGLAFAGLAWVRRRRAGGDAA